MLWGFRKTAQENGGTRNLLHLQPTVGNDRSAFGMLCHGVCGCSCICDGWNLLQQCCKSKTEEKEDHQSIEEGTRASLARCRTKLDGCSGHEAVVRIPYCTIPLRTLCSIIYIHVVSYVLQRHIVVVAMASYGQLWSTGNCRSRRSWSRTMMQPWRVQLLSPKSSLKAACYRS